MKSIKQLADELNIDKQRVYRFIKKNHITEAHQERGVMYYDKEAQMQVNQHFLNVNTASTDTSKDTQIEALFKQLEAKDKQLEAKDKQLEAKDKQIKDLTEQNKFLLLKTMSRKQRAEALRITSGSPADFKKWWKFWK